MILRAAVIAVELAIQLCSMGEKKLERREPSTGGDTDDFSMVSNGENKAETVPDAVAA